jgi:hypothetical protein
MTQLQDTAAMHAALNYALTKAERQIEAGKEIPWQDLEDAIELVVKHGPRRIWTGSDARNCQSRD